MKRIKKIEGDQLPIDELLPDAPEIVNQIRLVSFIKLTTIE